MLVLRLKALGKCSLTVIIFPLLFRFELFSTSSDIGHIPPLIKFLFLLHQPSEEGSSDSEPHSPRVANIQSHKFSAFDAGYITTRDVISNINNFFKAPAYEHDVAIFSESTKQPFAVSELVSLTSSLLKLNAKDYKGPALVISGEFDYILCGGYCPGELSASFDPLFTESKGFETYVQPAAGHGLNFHKNATGAFGVIFEYLEKNGI